MSYREITKPIGLGTICREIEATCRRAQLYKRCGLRPEHLILPLDPGCGRTVLLEYMTAMYKEAGVLNFSSGLDDMLEIVFDGTLPQLKDAFAAIRDAAVYANEYCGLIGMDISELALHLGETQVAEFLKRCRQACDHACVVFFLSAHPSRNEERLLDKLCESVDHVKRLEVEPYTAGEMLDLVVKLVEERGVEVRNSAAFHAMLEELQAEFFTDFREAPAAADVLVRYADFSGFTPILDEHGLKTMLADRHGHVAERSEVK